jgi:hypothetical protein
MPAILVHEACPQDEKTYSRGRVTMTAQGIEWTIIVRKLEDAREASRGLRWFRGGRQLTCCKM